jgi:Flp pilus assembly pilin Flp
MSRRGAPDVWSRCERVPHRRVVVFLRGTASHERGQDVVEYGLIIAAALVVLLGTLAFGNLVGPWFQHLGASITTTGT